MRHRPITPALVGALAAFTACSDSQLYQPFIQNIPAIDRSVTVKGQFCTDPADDVERPIKIIIAMDTSLSMVVSDPTGSRAKAMVQLIDSFPSNDPDIYVGVLLFAGFTPVWLTNGGLPGFSQVSSLSQAAVNNLSGQLLAYSFPNGDPNRGATDFVKPLDAIYTAISQDISTIENTPLNTDGGFTVPVKPRYSVIFLTDGAPTFPEDSQVFSRCQAIRALTDGTATVTLNTVHVFEPTIPVNATCEEFDGGVCQIALIQGYIARLQEMAKLGGGEFRDFENNEPVNFLSFQLGASKQINVLGRLTLYNLNALAHSPVDSPDSDGDGLPDWYEEQLGTDPTKVDSLGDGYSDGVKMWVNEHGQPCAQTSDCPVGATCQDGTCWSMTLVLYPDGGGNPGCPSNLIGIDSDGDGLTDCDEQVIGSDPTAVDTDGDGIYDLIEWLGGTAPATPDITNDYDADGLLNGDELMMHTNPNVADVTNLDDYAYRYSITKDVTSLTNGSLCYNFEIDNVLLVPTLDIGGGPGINTLVLAASVVAQDDPTVNPITHIARYSAGYPIDGIKSPPDGVIPVQPTDFVRYLK